jgi:hypothetical protein
LGSGVENQCSPEFSREPHRPEGVDASMTELPILDEDYWTALEILAEETGNIRDCMAQKLPWNPADGDQFDWAMRTFQNWHPDDAETYLLDFPWPKPGEVPDIPQPYFVPTLKEKAKIQWFIENFSGEEDDPWVKDMVELAKAVLDGVH